MYNIWYLFKGGGIGIMNKEKLEKIVDYINKNKKALSIKGISLAMVVSCLTALEQSHKNFNYSNNVCLLTKLLGSDHQIEEIQKDSNLSAYYIEEHGKLGDDALYEVYTIPKEVDGVVTTPTDTDIYDGYCYGSFIHKDNLPEACILVYEENDGNKKLINILKMDKRYRSNKSVNETIESVLDMRIGGESLSLKK